MDDQDYVEKKRLQMARYFDKIIKRKRFYESEHFIHFLTNDMSPTLVGHGSKGVLSFLRFNRAPKNRRGGFHSYKASEPVEGDENDVFHRHQIYILMQESYFGSIAEALSQMIQLREGLADTLTDLGDTIIETTQSKYQLGDGIKYRNLQRTSDRKMQLFGLLMDELGFYITRQGKEEDMQFGDVLLEYKNGMDSLKVVFNARTQKLMEYVESAKVRNRKRDRADKLKLRLGLNAQEVRNAITEEQQATDDLAEHKKRFDECQSNVKNEIKVFETQKARDLTKSMTDYAHLNLRYERAKLTSLEKTLKELRSFQPNPISHNYPFHIVEEEDIHSSSSITSSSSYRDRNNNKRRHAGQHRRQKTLHASMSLPTCSRKHSDDDDDNNSSILQSENHHGNSSSTSGNNNNNNKNKKNNKVIKRSTTATSINDDHGSTTNPSHVLSSSYDERLGVRNQSSLW
ncbi:unnamed protein product [Cunninghamella blakesleeana]